MCGGDYGEIFAPCCPGVADNSLTGESAQSDTHKVKATIEHASIETCKLEPKAGADTEHVMVCPLDCDKLSETPAKAGTENMWIAKR